MVLLDAFATVAGHAVVAFFKQYRSNRAREEYGRLLALEVSRREAAEKREAAERVAREVAEARLAELEALRAPTPPVGGRRASWPSAPVQAQERNDQPPAAQRFDLDQFRVRSAESLPG